MEMQLFRVNCAYFLHLLLVKFKYSLLLVLGVFWVMIQLPLGFSIGISQIVGHIKFIAAFQHIS